MAEWFAMGGHGTYIWGSFAVTALFMIGEALLVVRRRRTLVQRLGRMIRMNSEVK
jgi:heme exporter protein D